MTLVEFYPKAGRTHQIRVHSSFKGHPIFGDKKWWKTFQNSRIPSRVKKYYNEELLNLIDMPCMHQRLI